MAASFVAASSQRLNNSTPPLVSTGYPLTVGCWCYPTQTASAATAWAFSNSTTDNSINLYQNAGSIWRISSNEGGAENNADGSVPVANAWAFFLCRAITTTNRRIACLDASGKITHGNSTVSRTPTGLNNLTVGARNMGGSPDRPFGGLVGEFWYTASDIQADGAQLQDALLLQLARGGPFSVPHIAKDILEYRSLRKHPTSDGDVHGDVYCGASGQQTWTNTAGTTIGPHPPVPYWYVKPDQYKRELMI